MTIDLLWRNAIRTAMSYSGVTRDSGIVKHYAAKYNLSLEDLETLEKEAEIESKKFKKCVRCGGRGYEKQWLEYLILCDCPMSKRFPTLGAITHNSL